MGETGLRASSYPIVSLCHLVALCHMSKIEYWSSTAMYIAALGSGQSTGDRRLTYDRLTETADPPSPI